MEIINVKNKHLLHHRVQEYGCVCSSCGASFCFVTSELDLMCRDNTIHPLQRYIRCPHCGSFRFQDEFIKFESDKDKENFITKTENK